ncbi:MAG: hypothetical protein H0X31_00925 [Nostocaceae cyanobacterium]|nr:hypothetical protein [Nostocaceae cyanobacterium]
MKISSELSLLIANFVGALIADNFEYPHQVVVAIRRLEQKAVEELGESTSPSTRIE